MKFRQGFVSNSSTTSFCIFGVSIDEDVLGWDAFNKIESELPEGFVGHYTPWGTFLIGRNWSTVKDDETGGFFRETTKIALEKMLNMPLEMDTFEGGFNDNF